MAVLDVPSPAYMADHAFTMFADNVGRFLDDQAPPETIAAIAMTEPGTGSDLQSVRTAAKRDGNHYLINSQKTFITNSALTRGRASSS